ncbi:hypothetical protein JTB14_006983 [Gonioctena quinquepunctata]|nr:hypothetical protein JTB14_006983 [Gonioctena quinquepunctata]
MSVVNFMQLFYCFQSPKPGGESGNNKISDLITKSPTPLSFLFESTASCVVFQFIPESDGERIISRVPPYYDKLNSWLGQILQLDAPQVPIAICDLENVGVVLRFCPFENAISQQPTSAEIQSFVQCLEQQLVILRATVHHRDTFVNLVDASQVLKIVDLPDWAGHPTTAIEKNKSVIVSNSLFLMDTQRNELDNFRFIKTYLKT